MNRTMSLLSVTMTAAISLTACSTPAAPDAQSGAGDTKPPAAADSSSAGSGDEAAYAKYDKPVTLKIAFSLPDTKLPEGETFENNPLSRYLEKNTNIKVVHAWEAKANDPYKQKVNLSIASNDLPDALVVDRDQLKQLIENDMVADLTDALKNNQSSLVKAIYDSTGGKALADASYKGRLYGLPNVAIEADAPTYLWVRQDWLDKLKLQPPKTMDDIEKIAKAFKEQDPDGNGKADTEGLSGYKDIVYGTKAGPNGFDSVFAAYHSFPKNWIKDANGNVVYGSIAPETKQALAQLADWFEAGLIDPQFALRKETQELVVANKVGLFFGPWWAPAFPLADSVTNETKAEWKPYAAPVDANGTFQTHMAPTTDRFIVVRKGYEHPDAVVKLLNAFTRIERQQDPNKEEVAKLREYGRNMYPFDLLLDYSDAIVKRHDLLVDALAGKVKPEELDPDTKLVYDNVKMDQESPKKDINAWKSARIFLEGGEISKHPMNKVYSVFYGKTRTMETKWSTLEKMETETFLKIIMGNQPVDSFDDFVKQWKQLGGDQITQEVQDAVKSK